MVAKLKELDGIVRSLSGKTDAELREAMNDSKAETRWAACWQAGNLGVQGLRDDMIALLSDRDTFVRQAARRGLVILANREAIVRSQKQQQPLRREQLTDFGPSPTAGLKAQLAASRAWKDWWDERDGGITGRSMRTPDPEIDELVKPVIAVRDQDDEFAASLEKLRDGKGNVYTDALARVIDRLGGNPQRLAREALVERLTRMTVPTLGHKLADPHPEVRRAAALAATAKESRDLVPDLIKLLEDPEKTVSRCAHVALKCVTEKDFGPPVGAAPAERSKAAAAWERWLKK